jgi:transcriptional regulator with XRE-family HTH domain
MSKKQRTLYELIKNQGLTIREAANHCGVSKSTLKNINDGEPISDINIAHAVEKAFGYEPKVDSRCFTGDRRLEVKKALDSVLTSDKKTIRELQDEMEKLTGKRFSYSNVEALLEMYTNDGFVRVTKLSTRKKVWGLVSGEQEVEQPEDQIIEADPTKSEQIKSLFPGLSMQAISVRLQKLIEDNIAESNKLAYEREKLEELLSKTQRLCIRESE